MSKIAEMRQKRGELWDRAKAFLNEHADENGMMSAEDTATYERMEQELDSFGAAIDRQERAERLERALSLTGLTGLRHASVLTLSGGELQRTFLAQVFAQDPQILLLDEPANHLDLIYQKHIFSLIQQWLRQPGRAVLSVVHDLSLARKYGTHAVLMHRGQCAAQGAIDGVLSPERLQRVYGMDVYGWMRDMLSQWQ